jgi:hypothetical protein
MEAMLGVSLCSYLSLSQSSKNAVSFLLSLMSSLQQNWRKGHSRFCLEVREVRVRVRGRIWESVGRVGPNKVSK